MSWNDCLPANYVINRHKLKGSNACSPLRSMQFRLVCVFLVCSWLVANELCLAQTTPPRPPPPFPSPPSPPPPPPAVPSQRTALLAFLDSITDVGGDPSGALTSWSHSTSECTWAGVTCDTGNMVTAIDVSNSDLHLAWLPDEFQYLQNLKTLSLGGNGFGGTLPHSWSKLTALTELLLANNQLVGTLPAEWGPTLTALYKANLASNQLSGTVPVSYTSMSASLFRLILDSNAALCGPLPPGLSSKVSYTGTGITQPCQPPLNPPSSAWSLLKLKAAITSDPNAYLATWNESHSDAVCSSWEGVTCTNGAVTGVDVSFSQLQVIVVRPPAQFAGPLAAESKTFYATDRGVRGCNHMAPSFIQSTHFCEGLHML